MDYAILDSHDIEYKQVTGNLSCHPFINEPFTDV